MKKMVFIFCFLFYCIPTCYAQETNSSTENKNVMVVKEMFSDFAEKLNINKLDTYYTKDFILESNGKDYSYDEYKNLQTNIYKTLKSLTIVKYDDIFATDNKVVSRMTIRLVNKDGNAHEFQVILIALIKDNKIDRIWEITYPSWSDKLSTGENT